MIFIIYLFHITYGVEKAIWNNVSKLFHIFIRLREWEMLFYLHFTIFWPIKPKKRHPTRHHEELMPPFPHVWAKFIRHLGFWAPKEVRNNFEQHIWILRPNIRRNRYLTWRNLIISNFWSKMSAIFDAILGLGGPPVNWKGNFNFILGFYDPKNL